MVVLVYCCNNQVMTANRRYWSISILAEWKIKHLSIYLLAFLGFYFDGIYLQSKQCCEAFPRHPQQVVMEKTVPRDIKGIGFWWAANFTFKRKQHHLRNLRHPIQWDRRPSWGRVSPAIMLHARLLHWWEDIGCHLGELIWFSAVNGDRHFCWHLRPLLS